MGVARDGHATNGTVAGRTGRAPRVRVGSMTPIAGHVWRDCVMQTRRRRYAMLQHVFLQQLLGSSSCGSPMSILRVATKPVTERARCFMDNDDLGRLGSASTLLYTVSIALTLWAVWDPAVPGVGQWIGSPVFLRRAFLADGRPTDVVV